jgi:hypothetical protein
MKELMYFFGFAYPGLLFITGYAMIMAGWNYSKDGAMIGGAILLASVLWSSVGSSGRKGVS